MEVVTSGCIKFGPRCGRLFEGSVVRCLVVTVVVLSCLSGSIMLAQAQEGKDQSWVSSGRYLALPARKFSHSEAQNLANTYDAVTRMAPSHGLVARLVESGLAKSVGPSAYMKITAREIRAMMASGNSWEILVIPENRDFVVSVFKILPDTTDSGNAYVTVLCERTQDLVEQITRLGLPYKARTGRKARREAVPDKRKL